MKATISKAKYRMAFEINQSHCKNAKPKDPCRCVVAQAMYDKFGDHLATVHVLSTKTTLYFHSGKVRQYRTPTVLRNGLKRFDQSGVWDLPAGTYFLLPAPDTKTENEVRKNRALDPNRNHKNLGHKKKPAPLNPRLITLRKMGAK
jgi:hypothetical protein